ncbi:MAG: hypothetical protein M3033_08295 [Acidobacteriota bacterium]|nr:hypothetical protein [Acidobacteriota bacterium]
MFGVEKLRPDWRVKTYVILVSRIETGDEFWAEARNLKNAWNEIVAAYRAFDEQIATLETELARLRREKLDEGEVKTTLSRIRAERKEGTLATCKAQSPNVLYNDLENLRMAVESAVSLTYKNGGTLHFKKGVQSVNFTKRFKSGGIKLAELLTELNSRDAQLRRKSLAMRVGVKRESNRSRNKTPLHCHFLVGKSRVPVKFTGVWSYSFFPEAAFVKKAALVGKFSALKNWHWRLILTVEEPPVKIISEPLLPTAAIDLGYRRFAGYIRFGFVADSAGNRFELRLPDGNMISAYLKNTIKFLAKKGVEKRYITDLKDYFDRDAAQGANLEETKKQLKEISEAAKKRGIETPEKWREIFAGLAKMRNRRLLKLKKTSNEILEGANAATEKVPEELLEQTIEIVDGWQAKNVYFETEKEHFRRKFTGRRKLLYRQTVKWLASNYRELIWKEDLKLREMATKAKKSSRVTNAALKESNKFRQWASLHQLRLFIKE